MIDYYKKMYLVMYLFSKFLRNNFIIYFIIFIGIGAISKSERNISLHGCVRESYSLAFRGRVSLTITSSFIANVLLCSHSWVTLLPHIQISTGFYVITLVFISRSDSTGGHTGQRQISEKQFVQEGVSVSVKLPWSEYLCILCTYNGDQ